MPAYSVAAAAVAIEAPLKWVENLLSRYEVPGAEKGMQGAARRLSVETIVSLAIIRDLTVVLGVPVAGAVGWCAAIARGDNTVPEARGRVRIVADMPAIRDHVARGLSRAVESLVTPKRGRPRARGRRMKVPNE